MFPLQKKGVKMKFAIGSDFHVDVNQNYPFELTSDKDAFCLICGDTAGFPEYRKKWLEEQAKNGYRGAFVLGNHQVYHYENITIADMHKQLRQEFNDHTTGFKFLENDSVYFQEENILLIGCTLWTDFSLFGKQETYGRWAEYRMRDYKWPCMKDSKGYRFLSWEDVVQFNKESIKYLQETVEEYKKMHPGIKIVVMTHHAPSIESANGHSGKDRDILPAYVCNLEEFIKKNPEIKLWCHGHLHDDANYQIGECRVISNPRGYVYWGEDARYNSNFIVEI